MGFLSAYTKIRETQSHQVFQGLCLSIILKAEPSDSLDRDSETAIIQIRGVLETGFPFAVKQSVSSGLPLPRTQV